MMKEVSQTLLQMKQAARSVENGADSFIPLTDGEERETLLLMKDMARTLGEQAQRLYNAVAPSAFGEDK